MPQSIEDVSGGIIKLEVLSKGTKIPDELQVLHVFVKKSLNKIPYAVIEVADGNISDGDQGWGAIKKAKFEIGGDIEVKMGYGTGAAKTIFKGIVTHLRNQTSNHESPRVTIECSDKAINMTIGRKYKVFENKSDSQTWSTIVGTYSGISSNVKATTPTHKYLTQYGVTDWDFILTRAEINSQVIIVEDGEIKTTEPEISASPEFTTTYGTDLIETDLVINSRYQKKKLSISSWSHKNQNIVSESVSSATEPDIGDVTGSSMASSLKVPDEEIHSSTALESQELKAWGEALFSRSRLSKLGGRVRVQGHDKLNPNTTLELQGLSTKFNGKAYISSVEHHISEGNWYTDCYLGFDSAMHIDTAHQVSVQPGNSQIPGSHGIVIGVVKKIDSDPDSEYRVQINIPSIDINNTVWARLSNLYATKDAGTFFYPEIGDEVLVAFLDGDPRFPVILGSLYSSNSKHKAPYTPDNENKFKAIVSKNKLKIEFNDVDKILTIQTPGKIDFILDDKEKTVTLKDSHNNEMTMDSDGFKFKTPKNFVVDATGKGDLKSKGKFSIDGSPGVDVTGAKIKVQASGTLDLKAGGKLTANASGAAELSSSMITTIRGATVKIN